MAAETAQMIKERPTELAFVSINVGVINSPEPTMFPTTNANAPQNPIWNTR